MDAMQDTHVGASFLNCFALRCVEFETKINLKFGFNGLAAQKKDSCEVWFNNACHRFYSLLAA
jgi:hypothetical protein